MHAKSIVVDGRTAYVGSIDLETTERSQDRELGIILRQRPILAQLSSQFRADWSTSQPARTA
jgi:phosphatidylserine/phosphatidylglycerophosphate/cardiolipin synthase-like enzyme